VHAAAWPLQLYGGNPSVHLRNHNTAVPLAQRALRVQARIVPLTSQQTEHRLRAVCRRGSPSSSSALHCREVCDAHCLHSFLRPSEVVVLLVNSVIDFSWSKPKKKRAARMQRALLILLEVGTVSADRCAGCSRSRQHWTGTPRNAASVSIPIGRAFRQASAPRSRCCRSSWGQAA